MLAKLLKYDLKYMLKNMTVFYILAIFFAIVTRIFFSLPETVVNIVIARISQGCMISMIASILINVLMRSWVRFRDSIYKDEAYLTHTLPITKSAIYNSKLLQTLIFFIISFVVIILSLFITFYTEEKWLALKASINTISSGLNFNTTLFIIAFIAIIFLEIFNAIQCGFLGIILGHKINNNKIAFSVLFGFVSYIISQNIVLLLVFIVGLFNQGIMNLFKSNIMFDSNSFKLFAILSMVLYIIIIIIMSIVCKRELKKGVNIE